ncbi:hypothetical protein AciX9_4537 (plasmid) [Granulicella tundricola MP5ACTX9]|uniref:Uncharacterized protein n=1 Tax=Granulicella tundricola (strain ATCC BAA-1859 / DSM 23138 / MP5ACTX9) TaxID=1198114 RepID=E8X7P0_GRATM|nr:hypothetical protein AciX9_4537 [Granulicella tundricola MP5ACTX9]
MVPIEVEERNRAQASDRDKDRAFLSQWSSEDYPACHVGMGLLSRLAESSPGAYELALSMGFERPDHPLLKRNPMWRAFVEHMNTCGDCNEA